MLHWVIQNTISRCRRSYRVALLVVLCLLLSFLGLRCLVKRKASVPQDKMARDFLVHTPGCRIPNLNPFDRSIPNDVKQKGESIQCTGRALTYVDGSMLRINQTLTEGELKGKFNHCRYQAITRSPHTDFVVVYGNLGDVFSSNIEVRDEFIRVYCYNDGDRIIYVMFHAFVLPKEHVEARCSTRMKSRVKNIRPREILSVLMVGVDSVSRLNMMRQMPRTRQFLREELEAVEMVGYNKVADNTIVNIVPMTTGKCLEELPNDRLGPFDSVSFIWKNFSAAGYRTLFSEDAPHIGTFTFGDKKGFREIPVDYYFRPQALAMDSDTSVWNHNHHCVSNMMETEILLNYKIDFCRQFRNKPHFGLTFISRLTHDIINLAGAADNLHLRFLVKLKDEGLLENAVLIYFSDHGMRFGKYRDTYFGKAEARLPFMFIVLPSWFKSRYPKQYTNLKLNSNRLATPFDVYETLKDVLHFDGNIRKSSLTKRGISLFQEIPESRNCMHAGILPQWCMCMTTMNVSTGDRQQAAAMEVVRTVNSFLVKYFHLCAFLTLKTIHTAEELISHVGEMPLTGHWSGVVFYRLSVETDPGNARFEATVRFDEKADSLTVNGEITRTNSYGTQSKCVTEYALKQFCFCKDL